MAWNINTKKLCENPETENAGKIWNKDEDDELLIMCLSNETYDVMASYFKRTIRAIKCRIYVKIYEMIDENTSIEELCVKYNVELQKMIEFKNQKDNKPKKEIIKTCRNRN